MGISFHCKYCDRKIQAPDSAGGKWGKCPSCHNKLYVPDLSSGDELKLAPINEDDEIKQKQLMDETFKLTENILLEKEVPDEQSPSKITPSASGTSDKKLMKNIITYLQQMANGQLDKAEKTASSIIPSGNQAVQILDEIAQGEIPMPDSAAIPKQVLSGLIETLRDKIS